MIVTQTNKDPYKEVTQETRRYTNQRNQQLDYNVTGFKTGKRYEPPT